MVPTGITGRVRGNPDKTKPFRWKRGQSGNPHGRSPKPSAVEVYAELDRRKGGLESPAGTAAAGAVADATKADAATGIQERSSVRPEQNVRQPSRSESTEAMITDKPADAADHLGVKLLGAVCTRALLALFSRRPSLHSQGTGYVLDLIRPNFSPGL